MNNDKKYIASCSFGKDSLASIILAHIHKEPLDLILYSHVRFDENLSGEHPEHIDFIYSKAIPKLKKWGYNIKIVESEDTYITSFYHIVKRSKFPDRIGKYRGFPICGLCSINRDVKIKPIKDFYKKENMKNIIQYIGIAIDEPKRLVRMKEKENQISLLQKYRYTEEMAYKLCGEYDLLSPIYEFSDRGGCWFCPNCKDEEFLHTMNNHPNLWEILLNLGKTENLISPLFNRKYTINELDEHLNKINNS